MPARASRHRALSLLCRLSAAGCVRPAAYRRSCRASRLGFSRRLHGLGLLISDPFLGRLLGTESGNDLQVTTRELDFHLKGLVSIRVWDNPINCHAPNMA
jgi:hypothetical protein